MSGYILGIIFGLFFAILTHAFSVINSLLSPLLVTIRSTPVASFIIILLYILGKESVTVIISFLMTLPIVWDGVRAGMDNSPTKLEEVARIYSLPYLKKLKILYFPYSVSYLFSSAKTALGLGWKSGIAAEVLCTPKVSIGKALYDSKIYLESDSLFAWTIVIITISLFLEEVLKKIIVKFEKVTSI